ncbi:hypothetical protein M501DRAFT_11474 [Patellaria atrata CBS 101060]|uniref:Uncharacterized protein n=1 Tax=Patellaria atrata CBS 101060 TaxID=1346257 RepID=A0A9P4VT37_9PEZI|nr:hypothetical protein M501DRAFT_11474 [Patellaria atrata CBS 101060]
MVSNDLKFLGWALLALMNPIISVITVSIAMRILIGGIYNFMVRYAQRRQTVRNILGSHDRHEIHPPSDRANWGSPATVTSRMPHPEPSPVSEPNWDEENRVRDTTGIDSVLYSSGSYEHTLTTFPVPSFTVATLPTSSDPTPPYCSLLSLSYSSPQNVIEITSSNMTHHFHLDDVTRGMPVSTVHINPRGYATVAFLTGSVVQALPTYSSRSSDEDPSRRIVVRSHANFAQTAFFLLLAPFLMFVLWMVVRWNSTRGARRRERQIIEAEVRGTPLRNLRPSQGRRSQGHSE